MTAARLLTAWLSICPVSFLAAIVQAAEPDLIVHNGKIVTVDEKFSIAQAMAVGDGKIIAVGTDTEVMSLAGAQTRMIDLAGRTVLPGLIDSHVHPADAAMFEFDHPVPQMESIADVLAYVRDRAKAVGPGKWVTVSQVFITRLKEQRYPTRAELDEAAPLNPVIFATGPDASVNSLALMSGGIDKDFKPPAGSPGFAEKDAATGEPTGVLRGYMNYFKAGESPQKSATEEDRYRRTLELFHDYNANGLTTICDRAADRGSLKRYASMRDRRELTVRVSASQFIDFKGATIEDLIRQIEQVGGSDLHRSTDPMLKVIGIKMFLDGGMLTGSAYMSEPWGVSKIYGISDPKYQGVLLIPRERLMPLVMAAAKNELQFTAHCVGDGSVQVLLDAYEKVLAEHQPLLRPCITHCNFISADSISRMKKMNVVADIQPIWLYLDGRTLRNQFGDERLKLFQPLHDMFESGIIIGGGSDHMQKIGSDRAINPYNPFEGMWISMTRQARWQETPLHPEQALTREQAIRMYTTNNAWLLFRETEIGSLKKGMFADFVVIDRDILTCRLDDVRETKVKQTFVDGRSVLFADEAISDVFHQSHMLSRRSKYLYRTSLVAIVALALVGGVSCVFGMSATLAPSPGASAKRIGGAIRSFSILVGANTIVIVLVHPEPDVYSAPAGGTNWVIRKDVMRLSSPRFRWRLNDSGSTWWWTGVSVMLDGPHFNFDVISVSLLWPICILLLIAYFIRRRGRRLTAGQCAACNYDLRASSERCPECGLAIPQGPPITS